MILCGVEVYGMSNDSTPDIMRGPYEVPARQAFRALFGLLDESDRTDKEQDCESYEQPMYQVRCRPLCSYCGGEFQEAPGRGKKGPPARNRGLTPART